MNRTATSPPNARCTLVIAAAGYGKTETLHRWLRGHRASWHSAVVPDLGDEDVAVLDDLAAVPAAELRAFVERAAPKTRLMLVSRLPLPGLAAVPGLRMIGPADLALPPARVAAILREQYGVHDANLARRVHGLTAGWPALVHLTGARLVTAAPTPAELLPASIAGPGTAPFGFVETEVLAPFEPGTRRLLRAIAHLGPVSAGLCRALGVDSPEPALDLLLRTGLLVPTHNTAARPHDDPRWAPTYRLVPLVAEVVRTRWPLSEAKRHRLLRDAAGWYERMRMIGAAVTARRHAADHSGFLRVLREHGREGIAEGSAAAVGDAIRSLPPASRDRELRLLLGQALTVTGHYDEALATFAADADRLDAGLAWRLGTVHYLRARPHAAIETFERVELPEVEGVDEAMLHASHALARWMIGDLARSGELSERALAVAGRGDDTAAAAMAHTALAMHATLSGDPVANAEHYERALGLAERAGDIVQISRVRANRAGLLLNEGGYPEALAEALAAAALAETCDAMAVLPVALCNAGEALTLLGRIEEASDLFGYAVSLYQRLGSAKVAYPLLGLADIHHWRGQHQLARAAYEEAVRIAEPTGDLQALVPALSGLALVLCREDPGTAKRLATRAATMATGRRAARALIVRGWVAVLSGDLECAAGMAGEAADLARRHRDKPAVAQALELHAAIDPAQAAHALAEAATTWQVTGATLHVDRLRAMRGRLPDSNAADRIEGRAAAERLRGAGIRLISPLAPEPPQVSISTLGRFEVVVNGVTLPPSAWQSRKARDLLRILLSRRGRMTGREEIAESLWPGEDSGRVGHRLSVALSVLRSVLDPDRRAATDHFIRASPGAVALDTSRVTIDVEDFLEEAEHGLRLGKHGRAVLAGVERHYTGDFLEDEPYEEWAVATRELARATYLRVVRALAQLAVEAGDVDEAIRWLLRILDLSPYDEQPHLDLVRVLSDGGRHGEARRAYQRYAAAMRAIGVAPSRPPAAGDRARPDGAGP
ncbi:BTAD domain-containing putative transcriptional regulator [Microtetraspora glauca]|uniref:BTAD domain-containing putative transcriptional regulator n=1 Tax=Microtetraspora glauca TaxID=1996 RepID=A0ABV3G9L1_MICGL